MVTKHLGKSVGLELLHGRPDLHLVRVAAGVGGNHPLAALIPRNSVEKQIFTKRISIFYKNNFFKIVFLA